MTKRKAKPDPLYEPEEGGMNLENLPKNIDAMVQGLDSTVTNFQESWKTMKASKLGRLVSKKLESRKIKQKKIDCFYDNIRCKQLEKEGLDYFNAPSKPTGSTVTSPDYFRKA